MNYLPSSILLISEDMTQEISASFIQASFTIRSAGSLQASRLQKMQNKISPQAVLDPYSSSP